MRIRLHRLSKTANQFKQSHITCQQFLTICLFSTLTALPGAGSAQQIKPDTSPTVSPEKKQQASHTRSLSRPHRGAANTPYRRISPVSYADGISEIAPGPDARYISNRIFADRTQNLFSENSVTQWAYNWGQFIDHSVGLRESGDTPMEIIFSANDPLELFTHDSGVIPATRSHFVINEKRNKPAQQINTVSSLIDAWAIYGGSEERLEWLREGPVDGDMSNNSAYLLMTHDGFLPRATERGDASSAPAMERQGQLQFAPDADDQVVIAGDVRANENIALTTVQTLFAREHNRIVGLLPTDWSEQQKFALARELVIATQQYITYEEFLPAVGVTLSAPTGYNRRVDPSITNEFATVGFRAHSMIHGEIEIENSRSAYDDGTLETFRSLGFEVVAEDDAVEIAVPLNIAFGQPQFLPLLGLDAIAKGLGGEPQYKNDEQIDNQLRSVLFQIPGNNNPDCLDGPLLPGCYQLVSDVGTLDIMRPRDHGIARYNDLREAYGLPRYTDFTQITGEASDEFPVDDPLIDPLNPIDDPDILDFIELRDLEGNTIPLDSEAADGEAVAGTRRTTLAARLKALYGDVDSVDAFVGMVSEAHLPGSELGPLQHASWQQQFEALRDGDRHFYLWNRVLRRNEGLLNDLGLSWRQSLASVVINNTDLTVDDIQPNLFLARD